jgi:hypothetical protein
MTSVTTTHHDWADNSRDQFSPSFDDAFFITATSGGGGCGCLCFIPGGVGEWVGGQSKRGSFHGWRADM